jgi:Na+-driven multidrug efflux pump
MKISRGTYPLVLAWVVYLVRLTIEQFSKKIGEQLEIPVLIVFIIMIVIGLILAIKDKELFKIVTDERTKKVDRSAVYYSWWLTLLFVFVGYPIGIILGTTAIQLFCMILLEMLLSMILFHMYFNFRGKF